MTMGRRHGWGLLALLLAGCGGSVVHYRSPDTGTPYYPPPAAFRTIEGVLGERVPASLRTPEVAIAYATTRRPGEVGFTDRSDGALHLGRLGMRIGPPDATWEDLVDWARLNEQQIPPVRVAVSGLERFGYSGLAPTATGPDARFLAALEPMYGHGGRRVLLFVHGYNTSFAEAAATLACMHHHQGRRGAAVLFSWPAGTEVLRYVEERELARESTNALARLITLLHGPGKVERIDCLVNSTGAQMLIGALHQLDGTLGREAMAGLGIGSLVLASPDVSLRDFLTDDIALLAATARRTVVYSNRTDRALGLSGWWHEGTRLGRLGRIDDDVRGPLLRYRDRVEVVDVTALPGPKDADGFTRHGAWYANPLVVTDAIFALLWGRPAGERGLVATDDAPVWTLPADYGVQVARALAQPTAGDP